MLDIYLIRHAQSQMNTMPHLMGGRSKGTPLSMLGSAQAVRLGEYFASECINFDELYSSTALRTRQTASGVGAKLGFSIDDVVLSDELLEIDQGNWEGKLRSDVYTKDVLDALQKDCWNFKEHSGESQKEVESRMLNFLEPLKKRHNQNLRVAIFSHGFSIKCLLRGILNSDPSQTYNIKIGNTSVSRLQYDSKGWHLVSVNDSAHLMNKISY